MNPSAARLAVCPSCRTAWEPDIDFPEPVRLMLCPACARRAAEAAIPAAEAAAPSVMASPSTPARPAWMHPAEQSRWKVAAAMAMLVLLVVACGYVASRIWLSLSPAETPRSSSEGAGSVRVQASPAASASEALEQAPPGAGTPREPAPDAEDAPDAAARTAPAASMPRTGACTAATQALGLCEPGIGESPR